MFDNITIDPALIEFVLTYVFPVAVGLLITAAGAYGLRWIVDLLIVSVWRAIKPHVDEPTDKWLIDLSARTGIPVEALVEIFKRLGEQIDPPQEVTVGDTPK